MTMDKPKIGRVDCTYDLESCDLLVNHVKESNQTFPYMIMFTKERSHVYIGPINADKIYNDFIIDNKFLGFPIHGGKGYTTKQIMAEGGKFIISI